jgi:hypothetical protein
MRRTRERKKRERERETRRETRMSCEVCGVCVSSLRGQFCKMYLSPGLILNCISFRQTLFTGRAEVCIRDGNYVSFLLSADFSSLY